MSRLRRILPMLLLAIAFVMSGSNSRAGEKTLGVRLGYNTRSEAPLAGLFFQYSLTEHFRLSPNVEYYFKHKGTDALSVNLNAHFPFTLGAGSHAALYPLAGVNFTSWNFHQEASDIDDVTTRASRLGLNLGGGFEYYATKSLKLSLEAKATLIKNYSSGTFSLSIGYVF